MKYSFRIETDDAPLNPREEFDNLSTFYAAKDSHYITGGKNDVEYSYREDLEDAIKALRKEGAVIVEFSGNAGTEYAVIERDQLKKEYLDFGYSMCKALYHARQCAKGEIEEWQAWANGEVYGYIVEDEDGKHLDSCWGYYGDDGREEAEREAKSLVAYYEEKEREEQAQLEDRLNRAGSY